MFYLVLNILIVLVAAGLLLRYWPSPKLTIYFVPRSNGSSWVISRRGIWIDPAPDYFESGAFDALHRYISRLRSLEGHFHSLGLFTPDGERGFAFHLHEGILSASFTIEWRENPEREERIRNFFRTRGIDPTTDYLAGNGGVPDATRCLDFPLSGSDEELTSLCGTILQQLCQISPDEALNIDCH